MAQRITIVDDFDLDSEAVGSVEFGFRITGPGNKAARQEYVLDVNASNLAEISETLSRWAARARKADKSPAVIKAAAGPDSSPDRGGEAREWYTPPDVKSTRGREQWSQMRKEARTWALGNGWPDLGDRGRVPDDAYYAWKKAMGWTGQIFEEWTAWRETQDAARPPKRKAPRSRPAAKSTQNTLI